MKIERSSAKGGVLTFGDLKKGEVYIETNNGDNRVIMRTDEGYVALGTGTHFQAAMGFPSDPLRRYRAAKAELVIED